MRLLLGLLTVYSLLHAADLNQITGTWRANTDKMEAPKKPYEFELGNGTFKCITCDPPVTVKADGTDQPVKGHPSFDTLAVKIVSDRQIESVSKKSGKIVGKETITVSPEKNTISVEEIEYPPNGSAPMVFKAESKRSGTLKPGVHATSGAWVASTMSMSDNARDLTYELTSNGLKYSDPTGLSYEAKFDGKDYPTGGTNDVTTVALRKIGERSFEEIYKASGKVKDTNRITIAPDGKSLVLEWKDSAGFSGKWVFERKDAGRGGL